MPDYYELSTNFEEYFFGKIKLIPEIEAKIKTKHKVCLEDLEDAYGDPYIIVAKPKQKSPAPVNKEKAEGIPCEIYAETSDGRILFIICRLFPDGNSFIVTAYWANQAIQNFYRTQRERLYGEECKWLWKREREEKLR